MIVINAVSMKCRGVGRITFVGTKIMKNYHWMRVGRGTVNQELKS